MILHQSNYQINILFFCVCNIHFPLGKKFARLHCRKSVNKKNLKMPNKNKFNNLIHKLIVPKVNISKRFKWSITDGDNRLNKMKSGSLRDYIKDIVANLIEKKLIVKDVHLGKRKCYWIFKCCYCIKKFRADLDTNEIRPENKKKSIVLFIKSEGKLCGCGRML